MSTGKRIKEIRANFKLTSAEFAKQLDIPVRTIGSYEREEAQIGAKFLNALITKFSININWLFTGQGTMFISKQVETDINYIIAFKQRFKLTDDEMDTLIDILDSQASREMILKFIQVKKGDKKALRTLIYNLEGIEAIYG
jgi:transcriptional regulator with XRE-family HTH domain